MKKIMILSVGGSAEPVINAVKKGKADYYCFFCSSGPKGSEHLIDDPGDPCGDKRKAECPKCNEKFYIGDPKGPAIVYQTGLAKDQYELVNVADPDDLNECYTVLLQLDERIKERYGDGCSIVANYTGGTKTMSVALALMGVLNEKWQMSINKGPRQDLIKVKVGDTPVAVDKWRLYCDNQLIAARKAIFDYDYAYAENIVSGILSYPLDKQITGDLHDAMIACRAFDLWDKFNHAKALELLNSCKTKFPQFIVPLKKILKQQRTVSGYELVGDLLNNAARRASRNYFDDAVGRLYRAAELFAQTRLQMTHHFDSGNLQLSELPTEIRPKYQSRVRENSRLKLGLQDDYMLLADLNDPIGIKFESQKNKIASALNKRNESIFAHGSKPLTDADYRKVKDILTGFIAEAAGVANIDYELPQLPRERIV